MKLKNKPGLVYGIIGKGKEEISNSFDLLKKRDFSSNKGIFIKNSILQFLISFSAKVGSLVFTFMLARILLPEIYGLYALVISTTILFSSLSDLGTGYALVRYISKSLAKNKLAEAKSYYVYIIRIRLIALTALSLILLISARFLANNYFNKPVGLALMGGSVCLFLVGLTSFYDNLFQATNNFRRTLYRENIFQITRILAVPLIALMFIKTTLMEPFIFVIMLGVSLSYALGVTYSIYYSYKKIEFLKEKSQKIEKKKKKEMNKFIFLMSTTILSGIFLGYVDMIVLGRYVNSEYIGFYQAALTLVNGLLPLIPIGYVIFPIFSKLGKKSLDSSFKKSLYVTALLGVALFIFIVLVSHWAVLWAYGTPFLPSVNILRILALLIILMPLGSVYDSFVISNAKPHLIAKLLIITTAFNLILNYGLITYLLRYSQIAASYGAAVAVVASRVLYLVMIKFSSDKLRG